MPGQLPEQLQELTLNQLFEAHWILSIYAIIWPPRVHNRRIAILRTLCAQNLNADAPTDTVRYRQTP